MADHLPLPLKHLRFSAAPESFNYAGHGRGSFDVFQRDDRVAHVKYLKGQLDTIEEQFSEIERSRETTDTSSEFGLILNVSSEPGYPLKYESLESAPGGNSPAICLLNLRHEDTENGVITKASIFVPHGQLKVLENKISEYADPSKDSKNRQGKITGPRNAPLLNNIHTIAVAALEALWTDSAPLPKDDEQVWFELWIRRDRNDWEAQLRAESKRLGLKIPDQTLQFPDHIVIIVSATKDQLESSLDLLNCLSEIRIARPCSVGLTDLSGIEQEEWVDEALARIQWPGDNAPAVCLLDTGVNRNHPLIEPLLSSGDMTTVFPDGDASDDNLMKHGTPMAGLAAYGDLRDLMLSTATWEQLHRLESVRLIRSSADHEPENYGKVTLQAINEPESIAPDRPRIFCMAVTAPGPNTLGNPSSWSSALDMAASGTQAEDDLPRVILVSAGNTRSHNASFDYPETVRSNPIEDPAQAWNVITVGAGTNRINIEEGDDEARRATSVAPESSISPFTTTSHEWRADWSFSPDIVMEGGNIAKAPDGSYPHYDSLNPLSSASDFTLRPIAPFNATSAATALAARVAARITERYPDLRPETIRGLLVHSARWPEALLSREGLDPHSSGNTNRVQDLMRSYGYGFVDEQRALSSLSNETTFFVENIIQPYEGKAGQAKLNECHLIALPWPKDLLETNPDITATLRITLSYFIQPNPGSRTWEKSKKYKYASHLLGFKPKHAGQSLAEFKSKLNAEEESQGDSLTDPGWALGGTNRKKCGSLMQDVWEGSAAELAEMEHIAVFPRAKGWWATRKYLEDREEHGCHLNRVHYSLIISIETEANLPIYTDVSSAIAEIEAAVSVDVDA